MNKIGKKKFREDIRILTEWIVLRLRAVGLAVGVTCRTLKQTPNKITSLNHHDISPKNM